MTIPFVVELLEVTDLHRADLESLPLLRQMVEGQCSRSHYIQFLSDLYHVVLHFCPIMGAAVSRCPDQFRQLRSHLYEAMHDEQGHEQMVLDDLAEFDVDTDLVRHSRASEPVLALISSNYYLADRVHPCSVIGMSYVLELLASAYAGPIAAGLARGFGMQPGRGFAFLESHASLDEVHVVRLHALLNTLEDARAQQEVIAASKSNFYLFKEWIRQIA
ncbi:TenA family transcriptional regulator [Lacisediminimonas sp.]|uniref:TenA family transcriptional regulator n=1 Tax=Lacisediminimonas sp. TaxID=3060582 RepID=UPI002725FF2C|nr:iron-containing redox enzyme family protein [Lacisediminimonas sp.]MDO8300338.1 iron-containing redox enzyme family protein [Lacisediminimonas sp.]